MTKISRTLLMLIALFLVGATVAPMTADAQPHHRYHHRHHHRPYHHR